jgi:hypothetical protein
LKSSDNGKSNYWILLADSQFDINEYALEPD